MYFPHIDSCTSFEYYCLYTQNDDNVETIMSFIKSHFLTCNVISSDIISCVFFCVFCRCVSLRISSVCLVLYFHFVSLSMHLIRSSTRAHSSHAVTTHSENSLKTDARMVASSARRTHLIKIAQRDENHRQWFSIKSTKKKTQKKPTLSIYRLHLPFNNIQNWLYSKQTHATESNSEEHFTVRASNLACLVGSNRTYPYTCASKPNM